MLLYDQNKASVDIDKMLTSCDDEIPDQDDEVSEGNHDEWDYQATSSKDITDKIDVGVSDHITNVQSSVRAPKTLNRTRMILGRRMFAGVGTKLTGKVMFVASCVLDEEDNEWGSPPSLLKGPAGDLFQRQCMRAGLNDSDIYYTTICKHTLPRNQKMIPTKEEILWSAQILEAEIQRLKPSLIVCLGAFVFKHLSGIVIKYKAVAGGVFAYKGLDGCKLFAAQNLTQAIYNPEKVDHQQVDLTEIRKLLSQYEGITIQTIETDYKAIYRTDDLIQYLLSISSNSVNRISVDCEWGGATYVDGRLRSIQMANAPGVARYIGFYNERGGYLFDRPFEEVRNVFSILNKPSVSWIGHNLAADFVWMHKHLGIDIYKKAFHDTMFAELTLDEYADLKLERLSLKYSDLGRYDIDLILEKKRLKIGKTDGYAALPDAILIPYGCRDVDVPIRAYKPQLRNLDAQGLTEYYKTFLLPLVTDGFPALMLAGLPMSSEILKQMREDYSSVQRELNASLQNSVIQEATQLMLAFLLSNALVPVTANLPVIMQTIVSMDLQAIKDVLDPYFNDWSAEHKFEFNNLLRHFENCSNFNIRSHSHLSTWLFDVKKLPPVKSTAKDGFSVSWEKVEAMESSLKSGYKPAVDKQTLKILSEKDKLVYDVLELNNVGNIVKSFLRPADEFGNERGLLQWVQSNNRVIPNFALTESSRPRTFNPNVLNIPKRVDKSITTAFGRIRNGTTVDGLRSSIKADPGWCLVDTDLDTAEVVSLAYLSSDDEMIAACTDQDTQFVEVYPDRAAAKGYATFQFKKKHYLRCMDTTTVEIDLLNLLPTKFQIDSKTLLQHELAVLSKDGLFQHPKRDLHWELAEAAFMRLREMMDEDLERNGGKVGNFSIPYGATAALLDTMIEALIGKKPPAGSGEKLIEGYNTKWKIASEFLITMADSVIDPGYYVAHSGAIRRFPIDKLKAVDGIRQGHLNMLASAMAREARNYPMQHLVAYHGGRALLLMLEEIKKRELRGSPILYLYDAISSHVPLEERFIFMDLHKYCMSEAIQHTINGRTLKFTVDTGLYYRLGLKPSKEEAKNLFDESWKV